VQWCSSSGDGAEQLGLQDELALLVLLAGLVGLVILPADRLLALAALDVAHYVTSGRHVALVGVGFGDVDDAVEEVCLAVLAAKVLRSISSVFKGARLER
jgi:hypothetical protein